MKVLVACEYSGRVREAFRKMGHDAWSCDLLPADDGSPYHIQGDVLDHLNDGWDLMVAHPPCTHLAVSGARYFAEKIADGRQPWQFGHGETKATCLWLKNLPKLEPTNIVEGRENRVWKMPPSKDRWKLRSETYQGIADAIGQQWGKL